MTEADFLQAALVNPVNQQIMERVRPLGLPDCWLVAGCLFQTMWNGQTGKPATTGIKDYDLFYFDPDTSWEAEDTAIKQVMAATGDLGVEVELKNQARVHLWYEARFGSKVPPINSAREGIGRFLIECTCVGIAVQDGALHAPYGLDDLASGLLRPNPALVDLPTFPQMFAEKASAYQKRWPHLNITKHP